MGTKIEIRKIEIDDIKPLFDTGKAIYSEYSTPILEWNEKNLVEIISEDSGLTFIAVRKKKIAGFIIGTVINDNACMAAKIVWIGLIKPLKDTGIEHELFLTFKKEIISRGIKKITTDISGNDNNLFNFFVKMDFTDIGHNIKMHLKL